MKLEFKVCRKVDSQQISTDLLSYFCRKRTCLRFVTVDARMYSRASKCKCKRQI